MAGLSEEALRKIQGYRDAGYDTGAKLQKKMEEDGQKIALKTAQSYLTVMKKWEKPPDSSEPPKEKEIVMAKDKVEEPAKEVTVSAAEDQIKTFCDRFPDQCKTWVADLKTGLDEGLTQIGSTLTQQVKDATTTHTHEEPPPVEPEKPAEESNLIKVIKDIQEKVSALSKEPDSGQPLGPHDIPPTTYINWLTGHAGTVCPTCDQPEVRDNIITSLENAITAFKKKGEPDARPSEDSGKQEASPAEGAPAGGGGSTVEEPPTVEAKDEGKPADEAEGKPADDGEVKAEGKPADEPTVEVKDEGKPADEPTGEPESKKFSIWGREYAA